MAINNACNSEQPVSDIKISETLDHSLTERGQACTCQSGKNMPFVKLVLS